MDKKNGQYMLASVTVGWGFGSDTADSCSVMMRYYPNTRALKKASLFERLVMSHQLVIDYGYGYQERYAMSEDIAAGKVAQAERYFSVDPGTRRARVIWHIICWVILAVIIGLLIYEQIHR